VAESIGIHTPARGSSNLPSDGGFVTFASLGLPQVILKGIRAAGLSEPTAIQSKAIPTILQGNDLIGVAPSGSGKTGTYLIPHPCAATGFLGPAAVSHFGTHPRAGGLRRDPLP
jgi:Superfamily II DNA and RNA helicases